MWAKNTFSIALSRGGGAFAVNMHLPLSFLSQTTTVIMVLSFVPSNKGDSYFV